MLHPPPSSLPQALAKEACTKILECGHPCGGILDEDPGLPCLHRCRPSDQGALKQDADDMCMICFTEALSAAPAIYLKCGHVFHLHCTRMVLEKRWVGPRITFGFSLCPICKVRREEGVAKFWWGLVDVGYSQVQGTDVGHSLVEEDRFYIALFPPLEQTHCAFVAWNAR